MGTDHECCSPGPSTKVKNERSQWFSDNQNVVTIIATGSKQPNLQALAINTFSSCLSHHIKFEPEQILRGENEQADQIIDYDDWMLDPVVSAKLDNEWGSHSIDRFADVHNRQLEHFNGIGTQVQKQ